MRLDEIPVTIDGIRSALRRDRRTADKRAGVKVDQRIFPRERRVGERRGPERSAVADADPQRANTVLADLADIDEIIVELQEADMEEVEQTMVRKEGPARASDPTAMAASPPPLPSQYRT